MIYGITEAGGSPGWGAVFILTVPVLKITDITLG